MFTEYLYLPGFIPKTEKKYSGKNFSKTISHTLYPETSANYKCTLMLLGNRAYPEWINVECDVNKTADIVCIQNSINSPWKKKETEAKCSKNAILKGNFCYTFLFFKGNNCTGCHLLISRNYLDLDSLRIFKFIFIAIDVTLKSLLSADYKNYQFIIKQLYYKKYFSSITYTVKNISVREADGYFVKRKKYTQENFTNAFDNVFHCMSGLFISNNKVCDKIMNCGMADNSDEAGCKCQTPNRKCKYIVNNERRRWKCSSLYFTGKDGKCYSFNYDNNHTEDKNIISNLFKCTNGSEIDTILIDDLVSDCGESADDEPILKDILVNHT